MREFSKLSHFYLIAICFFVKVFQVCIHSCRKTFQPVNATRNKPKLMNRKFHISKDMVLRIVIEILNVNLMRKKDQQGEPEEKRREKRRGSTTNSAEMRSKVLDIARPQWWEASVQQHLTTIPSVTLKYIRQM